jgi:hypothetical protein
LVEALDFEPLIITLDINFYEVSGEKQRDLLQGLNLSNYSANNPLFLLPFSQNSINDKNVKFIGQVYLPMLNGRTSSIKVGQKIPVKSSSFYSPTETSLNPTNLVGKLIQTILPNQSADFNSTYIFEDSGLEMIATPSLYLDSVGEITLNLSFEFRNQYPEAERVSSPSFRNVELKTTQILKLNEPVLAASWDIERTAKENRPVLIPFVALPFKSVKSNRKSLMTLTAKLKNKENIAQLLVKEQELEARLSSILSVELLRLVFRQIRPRIFINTNFYKF